MIKKQSGITLVALIVTIVVLMILSTVSINAVVGENGIIRKAQHAKELYQNYVIAEEKDMNRLLEEYNNMMATNSFSETPTEPDTNTTEPDTNTVEPEPTKPIEYDRFRFYEIMILSL